MTNYGTEKNCKWISLERCVSSGALATKRAIGAVERYEYISNLHLSTSLVVPPSLTTTPAPCNLDLSILYAKETHRSAAQRNLDNCEIVNP